MPSIWQNFRRNFCTHPRFWLSFSLSLGFGQYYIRQPDPWGSCLTKLSQWLCLNLSLNLSCVSFEYHHFIAFTQPFSPEVDELSVDELS